jgi:hypothetical protein
MQPADSSGVANTVISRLEILSLRRISFGSPHAVSLAWLPGTCSNALASLPWLSSPSAGGFRTLMKRRRQPASCVGLATPFGTTIAQPARAALGRSSNKLGVACEEADECVDWLEYLRDARIKHDPALIDEARQIAAILTASHKTAKANSARLKQLPKS